MQYEGDGDTTCLGQSPKDWYRDKKLGKKRNRENPDNIISNISQNTEKSVRDVRRHAVTQTPERNHQPMLMGKIG